MDSNQVTASKVMASNKEVTDNKGNKDTASKVGMANKEATSREVTGSKVNKARDGDKTKDGECELTHMNT
jgi:hypothetical protein